MDHGAVQRLHSGGKMFESVQNSIWHAFDFLAVETNRVSAKKSKITYRTFENPDMESCWLNCCMQLMMSAFDHMDIQSHENKSPLWKLLFKVINVESMNPLPIRDVLIQRERERIIEERVN